jgi:hypothetical protein
VNAPPNSGGGAGCGEAPASSPACAGTDLQLWFPDLKNFSNESRRAVELARAICAGCQVREACLRDGMGEEHGVWAGLLPSERERLRKGGLA